MAQWCPCQGGKSKRNILCSSVVSPHGRCQWQAAGGNNKYFIILPDHQCGLMLHLLFSYKLPQYQYNQTVCPNTNVTTAICCTWCVPGYRKWIWWKYDTADLFTSSSYCTHWTSKWFMVLPSTLWSVEKILTISAVPLKLTCRLTDQVYLNKNRYFSLLLLKC